MKTQTRLVVPGSSLVNTIEYHLRNAGFYEEVIDEIVDALELKLEFNKYKQDLDIQTS